MRALLATVPLFAVAACAAPAPQAPAPAPQGLAGYTAMKGPAGELIVKRAGAPFTYAEGAEAKRAANSFCGPNGVASGDLDNFRDDAWVFPGGCA